MAALSSALRPIESLKDHVRKLRSFVNKQEVKEYYSFKEKLGAGFFATVYRAVEKKTDTSVAIKVINKGKASNKEEMLEEEVAILAKVRHPNCVSMIEIFESPKHLYVVMELVTGGELFAKICQEKSFSEADAARMISELSEGLRYLHSLGIVHRDLKPENILLENDQPNARIKITDFGLSKIVRGKKRFLHSRCGTPAYAAPELVEGKPYGSKVDMWAVGCILYILLSGCPPFWGADTDELFMRICSSFYPMDTPQMEPISSQAKNLVKKLLVIDPQTRYSAEQVISHPWITGDRKKLSFKKLSSQMGMDAYMKKYKDDTHVDHEALDDSELTASAIGDLDEEDGHTPLTTSLSMEDHSILSAPLTVESLSRLESKYPEWTDYNEEYRKGNILGSDPQMHIAALTIPSVWKNRAIEAGYIRPFLILVSMHPRQRLGFANMIKVDISTPLWFGDPHRESWEIINDQLEGLKAKTKSSIGSGSCWWDTLIQVSDATLAHFWSKDNSSKKTIQKRHNFSKQELKKAIVDPMDTICQGYEEVFVEACLNKMITKKGDGGRQKVFASLEDAEKNAAPALIDMLKSLKLHCTHEGLILLLVNWYANEGYSDKSDNDVFFSWVEKERTLNLSSVFLGKGRTRLLFPIVFAICMQRIILGMYGLDIVQYWPDGDDFMLRNSSFSG